MLYRAALVICLQAAAVLAASSNTNTQQPSSKPSASTLPLPAKPNILIFLNDQQNTLPWFPADWIEKNLPLQTQLMKNGLSFKQAYCNGNMCTPSRVSIWTGKYIAEHGSQETLTSLNYQSPWEVQMRPELPNLATILKENGYDVVYKGKWHASKGYFNFSSPDDTYIVDDIGRYGFDEWNGEPPLGERGVSGFGGGTANNDGKTANVSMEWLTARFADKNNTKPWCLVVSLVNPHDVPIGFPSTSTPPKYIAGGYDDPSWLSATEPPISLPPTVDEIPGAVNFTTGLIDYTNITSVKPNTETYYLATTGIGMGQLNSTALKQEYLNFYGRATQLADSHFKAVYDKFVELGGEEALNNTIIIRTSDHGEMALAHGGQRQKPFMPYAESLQVPLIWSNPKLWPEGKSTNALVSHVDMIPTLCDIIGADKSKYGLVGVSYKPVLANETEAVQDYVLYQFEDVWATFDMTNPPMLNEYTKLNLITNVSNGVLPSPNRLWVMNTGDYTVAINHMVLDVFDEANEQTSCYDQKLNGSDWNTEFSQPLQLINLSPWAAEVRTKNNLPQVANATQLATCDALLKKIREVVKQKLTPLPSWPLVPIGDVNTRFFTNQTMCPDLCAEVLFVSRQGQLYTVEYKDSNGEYVAIKEVMGAYNGETKYEKLPGNNGPVYAVANVPAGTTDVRITTELGYSNPPIPPYQISDAPGPASAPSSATATFLRVGYAWFVGALALLVTVL